MRTTHATGYLCVLAGASAALTMAACSGGARDDGPRVAAPTLVQPIVLDGDIGEWAPSVVLTSDPWWIYLRWKVSGEARTLQSSDESLAIWLDLDTNPATGLRPGTPAAATQLGVDLSIEFSPPKADGSGLGYGCRVTTPNAGGATEVPHGAIEFAFAPTYAGEWYEGRISRRGLAGLGLPDSSLATAMLVLRDSTGRSLGSSDPFEAELMPASATEPRADIRIPAAPGRGGSVWCRGMCGRARPMEEPGPFARVLKVLEPDVLLLQEWTSTEREIAAWLNASLPLEEGEWTVRTTVGWGVAVASRFPLEPLGHEELYLDGEEHAVRFAGALVSTPLGYLAASSVHLKCCGSSGSPEDQMRISEAGAINRSLAEALSMEPAPLRIIGGDLNLVGSRPPLDVLRNGLDADGSDLEIADARDLGTRRTSPGVRTGTRSRPVGLTGRCTRAARCGRRGASCWMRGC
jgi:hypothetical protein